MECQKKTPERKNSYSRQETSFSTLVPITVDTLHYGRVSDMEFRENPWNGTSGTSDQVLGS